MNIQSINQSAIAFQALEKNSQDLPFNLKEGLYSVRLDLEDLTKNPNDAKNINMQSMLQADLKQLLAGYNTYMQTNSPNLALDRVMHSLQNLGLLNNSSSNQYSDKFTVNDEITNNEGFLYKQISDNKDFIENLVIPSISNFIGNPATNS